MLRAARRAAWGKALNFNFSMRRSWCHLNLVSSDMFLKILNVSPSATALNTCGVWWELPYRYKRVLVGLYCMSLSRIPVVANLGPLYAVTSEKVAVCSAISAVNLILGLSELRPLIKGSSVSLLCDQIKYQYQYQGTNWGIGGRFLRRIPPGVQMWWPRQRLA